MVMSPGTKTIAVYELIEIRAILGPEISIAVTVAPSDTEVAVGTVLGQVTTDKLFYPYDNTKNDGRETARVILAEPVPASKEAQTATAYVKGVFYKDKLLGLDTPAMAELLAREVNGIIYM